ncbi:unnamed protein product [Urochloa humidicola]
MQSGDTQHGERTNSREKEEGQITSDAGPEMGKSKEMMEGASSDVDSGEPGLCFDDIISPGGEHYTFGTFQKVEIKQLWKMHLKENKSAVINEYGSNLYKYKSDPLAIIEAKQALFSTEKEKGQHLRLQTIQEEVDSSVDGKGQMESTENQDISNSFPSPGRGTQEAPQVEWSSQEDNKGNSSEDIGERTEVADQQNILSPEWGRFSQECSVEKLDEVEAEMLEKAQSQDTSNSEEIGTAQTIETTIELEVINGMGEQQLETSTEEDGQQKRTKIQMQKRGGEVRQSERVKAQGTGQLKISQKAEALVAKKNLEGEDVGGLEQAAEMIKTTALFFHPQEAAVDDAGMVLLQ